MDGNGGDEAARLSAVVVQSLDQEGAGNLPRSAYKSRTQFYRVFRALIDETPVAMRRRLLLERAAWRLSRTNVLVTEIALDADYGSLEAFTRAFRKAYRISPSLYRRMGATYIHLPAANGIHFVAPGSPSKGANEPMDLFDLFSGHDSWHTHQLLDLAGTLTDEQLDRPLNNKIKVFPWDTPDQSLRQILERIVQTKEVWAAALTGGAAPEMNTKPEDQTPAAMSARLKAADAQFTGVFQDVRKRGSWADTFVDALCEPPETFTFGGTFAHVVTFNAYRRLVAMDALRSMGVRVEGFGCPSEYEAALAKS